MRSRELLVGLESLFRLAADPPRPASFPRVARLTLPGRRRPGKQSHLADHGRWQQAVAIIDRLGQQHGADPTLVYNRALLGGWLADERALVAGLHAFAQMDVPLDDAIEAEAVAQLLDPDRRDEQLDSVVQVIRDQ